MSDLKRNAALKMAQKGFLDMLPLNLAVIPWGILCGSLAIQRDFSVLEAVLMSALVFAGAVQLVTVELIAIDAPLMTILFTAFIISSRHFLYGLALRDKIKTLPLPWRLSSGFLLTDESFALSGHAKAFRGKLQLVYAISAGGSFYIGWLIYSIIGIIAGSYLPDLTQLGLDFAIAATFIALVVPTINNLPTLVAVISAGLFSVLFHLLQWQLALVAASLLAMSAGYLTSRAQQRRKIKQAYKQQLNKESGK